MMTPKTKRKICMREIAMILETTPKIRMNGMSSRDKAYM
jgi:hypothetical protein